MSTPLVTRFAPSPSGHLHLGNARTALLNFLAARRSGGRFILRVEDIDDARSSEGFMHDLFVDLRWLGLEWDEGPDVGGPHATYRRRQRRAIYENWLAKLDAAGFTYPCFCTPAELHAARRRQLAEGRRSRYPGTCRHLGDEERAERLVSGQAAALRFRVPNGKTVKFVDLIHGEQHFASDDIGDFIIRRADGGTAFFFSNAIDDALMGVSLVMRGDDHLANTPRQLLLLQALNLPAPQYAHVALLQGMDGAPLSRRHGDLSLQDLRRRGFLPSAVRNHLVRLGHACLTDAWLDEKALIAQFDLSRLSRVAAKFDHTQLRHWQKESVAHLSNQEFIAWTQDHLPAGQSESQLEAFVTAVRHDVAFPGDVTRWNETIFGKLPTPSEEARATIRAAGATFFTAAIEAFAASRDFKQVAREVAQRTSRQGSAVLMPLRAALTSEMNGPELGPMLPLIAKEEIQARLEAARRLAQ